jgi:hypothetical protein
LPPNTFRGLPINRYQATIFSQPGGNLLWVHFRLDTTGGVAMRKHGLVTTPFYKALNIATNARISIALVGPVKPQDVNFPAPPRYDPYIPWPRSSQLGPR